MKWMIRILQRWFPAKFPPDYFVRWVNDGKLSKALDAGCIFVKANEFPSLGSAKPGDKVSQIVSKDGMRAYLMRVPIVTWRDKLEVL